MGAVGGLLGLNGGSGGSGFGTTTTGVTPDALSAAQQGVQQGLGNQQALLNALQAQGGLGAQSNVYKQLGQIAAGQGPNPAQAMLNQATGQNVANQAALMAGQRGSAQNVGLMARQAAQQGANVQQQAAGQGAVMQAQQQLNALGGMGNLANTMASNQIGATQGLTAAQLQGQQQLLNAQSAQNNVQGQLANTTMQGQQGLIGGGLNALGAAIGLADGGEVKNMADGGGVLPGSYVPPSNGPQSSFGQMIQSVQGGFSPGQTNTDLQDSLNDMASGIRDKRANSANGQLGQAQSNFWSQNAGEIMTAEPAYRAARGGKVPAMVSPGEKFLDPNEARAVAKGKANPMSVGETIPGKAKVKGDSLKNDTVRRNLDEGGIVIPRSVMQSKDPARGAADFVRAVLAKKGVR